MNLLEAMRYLAALEQHRHFGRAAAACHITQPALSNALRALEQEFGVTIVRRGRLYEGLTPEGARVLATAHRMLHEREVLQQELVALREQPRGNLTIGAVLTAIPIASRFAAWLQARHPGIVPAVRSLSSSEIEAGIDALSLDLAFGYSERAAALRGGSVEVLPQYIEHYFLLRRNAPDEATGACARNGLGAPITWRDAAQWPLCMLTPDMHNRSIIDASFAAAGVSVKPAIETDAVLALVLTIVSGRACSVMPGPLVALALQHAELEALPLIEPQVLTPIGMLLPAGARRSLAQQAALALARDTQWLEHASAHSGHQLPGSNTYCCCKASFDE
jgi:DNA-binding transcriptional LysR family regulator